MKNIENLIREALANGSSIDDVARDINTILNNLQQEHSATSKRNKMLEDMDKDFNVAYRNRPVVLEDAVNLVVLTVSRDYPNWGIEEINVFKKALLDNIPRTANMVAATPEELIDKLMGSLTEMLRGEEKKPSLPKTGATRGNNDKDSIERFLRNLR